jgi:hypothetical protein
LELLAEAGLSDPVLRGIPVHIVGLPADRFVPGGSVADLRRLLRLDSEGLAAQFREALAAAGWAPAVEVPSA